jgi:hypothetical protein
MLCAYVDEAGNTGSNINDPLQRYHYVGALVVSEDAWAAVKQDLRDIAEKALGKKNARADKFEFHGNRLFVGNGPWTAIPDRTERLEIYGKCLDLLEKHRLHFTYSRCDKHKLKRYHDPMHPHEISFWLTLERVANILNQRGSLGFIVADGAATRTRQIAGDSLKTYRKKGAPFGRTADISRLIDIVHFMESADSPHLQLCDLCLWAIQRHRSGPATQLPEHSQSIEELYLKVDARTTDSTTFPY